MINKISVCVASVYQREPEFVFLRSIAKTVIESFEFLEPIRSPEDVKTQAEFNNILKKSFALVLILGTINSEAVKNEFSLALDNGIPIIPLSKTTHETNISASKVVEDIFKEVNLNIKRNILFTTPDQFKEILKTQLYNLIIDKLESKITIYNNRIDIYNKARLLLSESTRFLLVAETSPTLFLGPRVGDLQRKKYYQEFINMLYRLGKNELDKLVILFNYKTTEKEMKKIEKYPNLLTAKNNILSIMPSLYNNKNIIIRSVDKMFTPFVIADFTLSYGLNFVDLRRYMHIPTFNLSRNELLEIVGELEKVGKYISLENIKKLYSHF